MRRGDPLAKLERSIDAELAKRSHDPEGVATSALARELGQLDDEHKRAMIVSLCERIATQRKEGAPDSVLWHTSEIVRAAFGNKKLAWTRDDAERIAQIAASLGGSYFFLPMRQIVSLLEHVGTHTPTARKSIKTMTKHMLAMEEAADHHRMADRLAALVRSGR